MPYKTALLVSLINKVDYIEVDSEIDALLLEANLIRKFQPKYNSELKDNKNYPLIEITTKAQIPQVKIARQETNSQAIYFGPFPTGSDISRMLRYLRRLFPFVSQKHHKNQACFRSHLGLCPCGKLSTEQGRREYRLDLNRLIAFLSGKRKSLLHSLEKQMLLASSKQDFVLALKIKNVLEKVDLITAPRTKPFEYETNPVLIDEKRELAIESLKQLLGIEGELSRIECYDISNTQGKQATAAMVVWTNGAKDSSQYRRFKINLKSVPSDLAMMEEVLTRRFKRQKNGWQTPNLIVVDGGAGQLGVAKKVLAEYGLQIPTIGLAKRFEEIYLSAIIKFHPPDDSPGLHLLEKMRDEAHRFSRKYHFLLRSKHMLS